MNKTQTKLVEAATQKYYTESVAIDPTAKVLMLNGVKYKDVENTLKAIGLKHGWFLNEAGIKTKILKCIEGKFLNHFDDVYSMAKTIDIPQLDLNQVVDYVLEYCPVPADSCPKNGEPMSKIDLKKSAVCGRLDNPNNKYGEIADWVRKNPKFTASQLIKSKCCTAPNARDYYEQIISFRVFFGEIALINSVDKT